MEVAPSASMQIYNFILIMSYSAPKIRGRLTVIMLTSLMCTDFTAIAEAICWSVQMVMQGKNMEDTDPVEQVGYQNDAY